MEMIFLPLPVAVHLHRGRAAMALVMVIAEVREEEAKKTKRGSRSEEVAQVVMTEFLLIFDYLSLISLFAQLFDTNKSTILKHLTLK